ncbi:MULTISPECIES: hypothetical protein [unclassified Sulfitobacter]|jgi:hypothetical protein|uniref:hypothetical protein n=1 Tax=unclassified Sulfitobacter TaxID=196795 RepID=UPI0007C209D9|nr:MULTISPECIES: hypothetical protein [unclassified Sulfitobacter]KZX94342.1 hypothetical protein A3721_09955 [Sulfitobacter sp. HI0023]KZY27275.1 hypothetical protein A3728_13005 [Sulfitobacter sp. HI0040]KZZ67013.1 hypothetical protein A3764_02870 [Sulfitobacter sp. HI0129]
MDPDLALTLGLLIAALSIPSIMSAMSDGRAPRASALTVLIAGGLIIYAVRETPGGYSLKRIPDVIVEVAARYLP